MALRIAFVRGHCPLREPEFARGSGLLSQAASAPWASVSDLAFGNSRVEADDRTLPCDGFPVAWKKAEDSALKKCWLVPWLVTGRAGGGESPARNYVSSLEETVSNLRVTEHAAGGGEFVERSWKSLPEKSAG